MYFDYIDAETVEFTAQYKNLNNKRKTNSG